LLELGAIGGWASGLAVYLLGKARNMEGVSQFSELMGRER